MTTEYQRTQAEEAYWKLIEQAALSEAALVVFSEAQAAAYAAHTLHSYSFRWPIEYEEYMEKMRLAAERLTPQDLELLSRIWRATLAAAASIDPDDYETLVGHRVYRGDLHWFYRMLSHMVEQILREKERAESAKEQLEWFRKRLEKLEPVDDSDVPF